MYYAKEVIFIVLFRCFLVSTYDLELVYANGGQDCLAGIDPYGDIDELVVNVATEVAPCRTRRPRPPAEILDAVHENADGIAAPDIKAHRVVSCLAAYRPEHCIRAIADPYLTIRVISVPQPIDSWEDVLDTCSFDFGEAANPRFPVVQPKHITMNVFVSNLCAGGCVIGTPPIDAVIRYPSKVLALADLRPVVYSHLQTVKLSLSFDTTHLHLRRSDGSTSPDIQTAALPVEDINTEFRNLEVVVLDTFEAEGEITTFHLIIRLTSDENPNFVVDNTVPIKLYKFPTAEEPSEPTDSPTPTSTLTTTPTFSNDPDDKDDNPRGIEVIDVDTQVNEKRLGPGQVLRVNAGVIYTVGVLSVSAASLEGGGIIRVTERLEFSDSDATDVAIEFSDTTLFCVSGENVFRNTRIEGYQLDIRNCAVTGSSSGVLIFESMADLTADNSTIHNVDVQIRDTSNRHTWEEMRIQNAKITVERTLALTSISPVRNSTIEVLGDGVIELGSEDTGQPSELILEDDESILKVKGTGELVLRNAIVIVKDSSMVVVDDGSVIRGEGDGIREIRGSGDIILLSGAIHDMVMLINGRLVVEAQETAQLNGVDLTVARDATIEMQDRSQLRLSQSTNDPVAFPCVFQLQSAGRMEGVEGSSQVVRINEACNATLDGGDVASVDVLDVAVVLTADAVLEIAGDVTLQNASIFTTNAQLRSTTQGNLCPGDACTKYTLRLQDAKSTLANVGGSIEDLRIFVHHGMMSTDQMSITNSEITFTTSTWRVTRLVQVTDCIMDLFTNSMIEYVDNSLGVDNDVRILGTTRVILADSEIKGLIGKVDHFMVHGGVLRLTGKTTVTESIILTVNKQDTNAPNPVLEITGLTDSTETVPYVWTLKSCTVNIQTRSTMEITSATTYTTRLTTADQTSDGISQINIISSTASMVARGGGTSNIQTVTRISNEGQLYVQGGTVVFTQNTVFSNADLTIGTGSANTGSLQLADGTGGISGKIHTAADAPTAKHLISDLTSLSGPGNLQVLRGAVLSVATGNDIGVPITVDQSSHIVTSIGTQLTQGLNLIGHLWVQPGLTPSNDSLNIGQTFAAGGNSITHIVFNTNDWGRITANVVNAVTGNTSTSGACSIFENTPLFTAVNRIRQNNNRIRFLVYQTIQGRFCQSDLDIPGYVKQGLRLDQGQITLVPGGSGAVTPSPAPSPPIPPSAPPPTPTASGAVFDDDGSVWVPIVVGCVVAFCVCCVLLAVICLVCMKLKGALPGKRVGTPLVVVPNPPPDLQKGTFYAPEQLSVATGENAPPPTPAEYQRYLPVQPIDTEPKQQLVVIETTPNGISHGYIATTPTVSTPQPPEEDNQVFIAIEPNPFLGGSSTPTMSGGDMFYSQPMYPQTTLLHTEGAAPVSPNQSQRLAHSHTRTPPTPAHHASPVHHIPENSFFSPISPQKTPQGNQHVQDTPSQFGFPSPITPAGGEYGGTPMMHHQKQPRVLTQQNLAHFDTGNTTPQAHQQTPQPASPQHQHHRQDRHVSGSANKLSESVPSHYSMPIPTFDMPSPNKSSNVVTSEIESIH